MGSSVDNRRVSDDVFVDSNSSSPLRGHSSTPSRNIADETVDIDKSHAPSNNNEWIQVCSKRRRSDIWKHYDIVREVAGGKLRGICKYCHNSYDADPTKETSVFIRHNEVCREYKKLNPDSDSPCGRKFDQKVFRRLLAEALMRHDYSYSWVEHEATRKVFKYLNDKVELITRNTMRNDYLQVHAELKDKIMQLLRRLPGKICLTSDLWTACTSRGHLSVTAHYLDQDWKFNSKLLCFKHCAPPHGGYELSVEIGIVIHDWRIDKKIFSLTVDNASNMDRMVLNLKEGTLKDLPCKGKYFHIRCVAHILNLIVKNGLKVVDYSIAKLREGIKYIDGSEARKLKFQDLYKKADVSYSGGLWLDVPTRWNSTYVMIERALNIMWFWIVILLSWILWLLGIILIIKNE